MCTRDANLALPTLEVTVLASTNEFSVIPIGQDDKPMARDRSDFDGRADNVVPT